MSADILPFPVQGKPCRTCGFIMVHTKGEQEYDECHCCRHTIPLPLQWENPCPTCNGHGNVEVPIIRDDRDATVIGKKWEPCMTCLGKGHTA